MTRAAPPWAVLIHGSCVTRDAFALAEEALPGERAFALVDYVARSSLASAFAPQGLDGVDTSSIASPFQRRMVDRDLRKDFARSLAGTSVTTSFDALVIDLVDERHDLLVDHAGGIATRSEELLAAHGLAPDLLRVPTGSDDFLQLWDAGRARFIDAARTAGVLDKIVVHEALWAEQCIDGTDFDYAGVAAANHLLHFMYARLRKDLAADQFVQVPVRFRAGDPDHRWGRSPVHFTPAYYRVFLDLLEQRVRRLAE